MACNDSSDSASSELRHCCWVCLATEEDDLNQSWVQPCLCKGTSKWVHQLCLQRWIDEKQHGNAFSPVSCSQCNAVYVIIYPKSGILMRMFDNVETTIQRLCPYVSFGMMIGALYWTAVSHGTYTIIQIFGREDAFRLMDEADPYFLLVSLPTIPVMLIISKMVHWEDFLLRFWVQHFTMVSVMESMQQDGSIQEQSLSSTQMINSFPDPPISLTRVITGALILPTIASVFGNVFFKNISSPFQRTMLGGLTFVLAKGVVKTFYKQKLYVRRLKRKILDYEEAQRI